MYDPEARDAVEWLESQPLERTYSRGVLSARTMFQVIPPDHEDDDCYCPATTPNAIHSLPFTEEDERIWLSGGSLYESAHYTEYHNRVVIPQYWASLGTTRQEEVSG